MSEDGEKDQEKEQQPPSRPTTAAARRERRASARRDAGKGGAADTGKRPAPKGKSSGRKPDKAGKPAAKPEGKDRPTPKRDDTGKKQASLFSRIVRFLREVWAELRKVIWPTRKQMITYTAVVLVFVSFMIALVFALDLAFGEVVALVFGE
ncbi:preprotein translocase subunit SecE [Amycolatopsis cihanbeyliensis]|uniref:Protein translocase subunit SecE n=1 Tax=Amycolatopsis cihanbeyliensis TaxID=1128664 RepID=A0A542DJG9_AMYCI|nr:preprotein translocase subunit SecE [Amycolatopsis cihanbeyliensis]TQJ03239.1 preprotein translocase subunit SecE [Amycolatopsis cihanbeyliensis]